MADVEEIREYLDSHPEDHKQRWRLAKKLYKAWDYRSALDQLLLLREVWPDQVPVARYLAATYYRLGKYDDATEVLAQTLKTRPDDDALLEQLAKIYEGGNQFEKALAVWTRIAAIKPGPAADEALERLGMALGGTMSSMAPSTMQSGSAHGSDTLKTCPRCGEGNDIFSLRCTRCHGELGDTAGTNLPTEAPVPFRHGAGVVIGLSLLVIVGASVALFFWLT